ncbi:MAG TPA: pitrilysin family protein [Haliangiales bacterium]|nr:pitrilysin family protein [Haliangiales bacterium]
MRPLLLCLCALAGTARADVLAHEDVTLKNGLRVLILSDRRAPVVTVLTWYRVGSADEEAGKTGFAHLYEHLMFKGSPHVPDGVIDKLHEAAGGWANASTGDDATVYVDFASSSLLERMLWLEADRLSGLPAAIDKAKLDNQRDVVLNERRERFENAPYGMAGHLIAEALWPESSPYHHPTIGYPADLQAASLADVKAFFARHYVPANAVMVIAGDVDVSAARRLVERYLAWIPSPERPPQRPAPPALAPLDKPIELTATDAVQVPRVYLTWRGPPAFHRDEAPLDVATAILAGGKSSRLYRAIVMEKRLAQDVFAAADCFRDAGEVQIVATAKPGVKPGELVAALDAETARLAAEGPSAEELERARNAHEARFFTQLESPVERASQLATYAVMAGDADYFDKDVARYRAVTAADVKDVLRRTLTSGRVVLVVGPEAAHAP